MEFLPVESNFMMSILELRPHESHYVNKQSIIETKQ